MNGPELRAMREALHLTQAQLAAELGVSPNTVARWERGEMAIRSPKMVETAMKHLREVPAVTKFRIEPMEKLALLRIDPSSSPTQALRPVLSLDEDGKLDITWYSNGDNAVTFAVWHNRTLEWNLSLSTDAERLTEAINAGELDELLTRVQAGHSVEWDGSNHVGRLSEDGSDASEAVQTWLDGWADTLPDGGGLWDACDWLPNDPSDVPALTATTTDAELEALAETVEKDALSDWAVLYGTVSRLRQFREQLQKELAEKAEALATALNGYTGDNHWNDVVLSGWWTKLIDEEATEKADPSGASDIVILRGGIRVAYDEADKSWSVLD